MEEQSGVELNDDLIVLVVLKCHNLVNCMILTSYDDLIKDGPFLLLHISIVDPLNWKNESLLVHVN
jgi:hypothetical protein